MGNVAKGAKNKLACRFSKEKETTNQEIQPDPLNCQTLFLTLRAADELRGSGKLSDAIILLGDLYDKSLQQLGSVPEQELNDIMTILTIIKECLTAWKNNQSAFNPDYRRIAYLNLHNDDFSEPERKQNHDILEEKEIIPMKKVEEKEKTESKRIIKKERQSVSQKVEAAKPIVVKPLKINKDVKPLFSEEKITTSFTDPDYLYMILLQADELRTKGEFEQALETISEGFDDCVFNLSTAKRQDKVAINVLLQVFKATQNAWTGGDETFSPEFERLKNLKIKNFKLTEVAV